MTNPDTPTPVATSPGRTTNPPVTICQMSVRDRCDQPATVQVCVGDPAERYARWAPWCAPHALHFVSAYVEPGLNPDWTEPVTLRPIGSAE